MLSHHFFGEVENYVEILGESDVEYLTPEKVHVVVEACLDAG